MTEAWHKAILAEGELFRVGGAVRDRLRGVPAQESDLDYLVRALPPERLEAILRAHGKVSLVGRSFGVYKFTAHDGPTVDIVYPRRERSTGPGHRDFDVQWDWRLKVEDDLRRRDFTINAIAENLETGDVVDPCGGRADIDARVVRMIFPEAFVEDPLRILRGVRFATRFDYTLDVATRGRMEAAAGLLDTLSPERIQEELNRILGECERPSRAFVTLHELGALREIAPELDRCAGVEQNEYHPDDVLTHSLKTLDAAPRTDITLRWAALLHDLGKVDTRRTVEDEQGDRVVFYGHEVVGEEIARRLLTRLRFPKEMTATIASLVREHMFNYTPDWNDATVRRFIRRVGEVHLDRLFGLRVADCRSRGLEDRIENARDLQGRVETELREARTFKVKDLAVDGRDVIRAGGLPPGPEVGRVLEALLEKVLEDPALNRREALLGMIPALSAESSGKGERRGKGSGGEKKKGKPL